MDIKSVINSITKSPDYRQQIVHIEHLCGEEAEFGKLKKSLTPALQSKLQTLNITSLYSHQTDALNAVGSGDNVIISTATASGKSLCYQLATLEALFYNRQSKALYLFPTKALSQDQLASLKVLACPEVLSEDEISIFDGDTPFSRRSTIKRKVKILITNPDMLHLGILPNHQSWFHIFRNLRYVIIDEAHIYRGIFGSHMANVLHRLQRICHHYGSAPQYILCSATIANSREHAERLVSLPFTEITKDSAPHGPKEFVFWNPPVIDIEDGARRSSNTEASLLLKKFVEENIRCLVFVRSRKLTEIIYIYTLNQLPASLKSKISPYRAGYLPEDRRVIERRYSDGELLGLITTNALELGIDIGDLSATILNGYPGSVASTWQQAGRSGRGNEYSLSILIGQDNPLDQYLMNNPEFLFNRNFNNALINPDNPHVLKPHILCAAWENPLSSGEKTGFTNKENAQVLAELEKEGRLKKRGNKWYPSARIDYPAQQINIRSSTGDSYVLIDAVSGSILETIEASVAFLQIHPGALYLHQGETYLVRKLDYIGHIAIAEPVPVDYYTQPRDITEIHIMKKLQEKNCNGVNVYLGEVDVSITVLGYRKYKQLTNEVIGEESLDLPQQSFLTTALWFDLPLKAIDRIRKLSLDFHGALHACEHAMIGILPLFALCDRDDIGGVSTPMHSDTGKPQIFIHDGYPGGIGLTEKGFEIIEELWEATYKLVRNCSCQKGCPSCIQSPKCGNNNEPLDKEAAVILLQQLTTG